MTEGTHCQQEDKLCSRRNRDFWQEVKRLKHSKSAKCSPSSVVDGLANTQDIAS